MPCHFRILRRIAFLGSLTLLISHLASAQNHKRTAISGKAYARVEQMPQLPGGGGSAAIVQAIQQRLTYPPRALQTQVEGRVFVNFIVTPTGRVENISIVQGLVADCDSAVVQAVQHLPRFIPGRLKGRAVRVQFTLPVSFRITD
jgi:periplasmic protein TonB